MSGSTIEVYHTDRLGSVRAITDATGTVTATYRTDEFGIPTATTGGSSQPFRYTGEPRDATGLSYLRARYYDASIGRFMSRDTWGGFGASPLSLNRYSYVENNPATWSDPSGLSPSSKVLSCGGDAHGALDVGGLLFPPADVANAGIYACEGDWGNAALSGVGIVPIFGDILKWLGKSLRIGSTAFSISPKIAGQMTTRGWTQEAIEEAMKAGVQVKAVNKANGNPATRYVHPTTGQSVVVDNVTGEVIQVGAPGFRFGPGSGDLE